MKPSTEYSSIRRWPGLPVNPTYMERQYLRLRSLALAVIAAGRILVCISNESIMLTPKTVKELY